MFSCIPFDHKLYYFDGRDFRLFAFLHDGYWFIYHVSDLFELNDLPLIKFANSQSVDSLCVFIQEVYDIDVRVNDILISESLIHHDITDLSDVDFKELVAACCYYCCDYVDHKSVNVLVPSSYYDITRSH